MWESPDLFNVVLESRVLANLTECCYSSSLQKLVGATCYCDHSMAQKCVKVVRLMLKGGVPKLLELHVYTYRDHSLRQQPLPD